MCKDKSPEEKQMWCLCLMGMYGVLIWEDENVLEMNSGDGHTAVWMYLMPQNCEF